MKPRRKRKGFPVTDPHLDAPDGAIVNGYERHGDRWEPVQRRVSLKSDQKVRVAQVHVPRHGLVGYVGVFVAVRPKDGPFEIVRAVGYDLPHALRSLADVLDLRRRIYYNGSSVEFPDDA